MANVLVRFAILVLVIWLAWTLIASERRAADVDDDPMVDGIRDEHLA